MSNDTGNNTGRATSGFRGFATLSFFAADHAAATRWYAELFGIEPYFERPGYTEFRIGDHQDEIGIVDSRYAPHDVSVAPAGAFMYWHVDDLEGTLERLTSMGATPLQPITERGHGFVTAAVTDPFGNIVGIMHNAHYLKAHYLEIVNA
ncbi:VOC family protein [Dactylosporangium siamense]|uniref:Glyoxalase n=1 Tax=Dactylosporangium siamense TaxID=685454 RepID=A0A919PSK4_9ACTN|nr:VOC family protein [Dactylosporangium siamense]GIG49354.1 glyoxalase [Dactylosporangium siamense]